MTENKQNEQAHVAILIDAENVPSDLADQIFTQAAALGDICAKEIFGTATALTSWIEPTLKYAIHPNLTVKASKGKNSSDLSLVIGAMDLLIRGGIETTVIVSSDSDFSTLSVRLRTAGMQVVGMGAEKANPLWRTACSTFIVLSEKKSAPAANQQPKPVSQQAVKPVAQPAKPAPKPVPAHLPTHDERLVNIRSRIASLLAAENGRMTVNKLFQNLNKFHDYQVDQAGSKRKPLTYLTWAFGNYFHFEETPNGMMISLLPAENAPTRDEVAPAPAAPATADTQPAQGTTEGATQVVADVQQPAIPAKEELPSAAEMSAKAEPENKAEEKQEEQVAAVEPEANAESDGEKPSQPQPRQNGSHRSGNRRAAQTGRAQRAKREAEGRPSDALRNAPISDQKDIPARIRKALQDSGRSTVGEAALVTDEELRSIPSVGDKTIEKYRETINRLLQPTEN